MDKLQLRRLLRAKRADLTPKQRQEASLSAANIFMDSELWQKNNVAIYLAAHSELSLYPLIQALWDANKNCFAPVLKPDGKSLEFVTYHPQDELVENQFNILEPISKEKISPAELDIVFVPLLGFDSHGNRIGTGGGYYDRTFEFTKKSKSDKPILLGSGYDCQHVEKIIADPWDIVLNHVLTEKKIY